MNKKRAYQPRVRKGRSAWAEKRLNEIKSAQEQYGNLRIANIALSGDKERLSRAILAETKKQLKKNHKQNMQLLYTSKGKVRKKYKDFLISQIKKDSTLTDYDKQDFINYFLHDLKLGKYKDKTVGSVLGMIGQSKIGRMINNSGWTADEIAQEFAIRFNETISADDVMNPANWTYNKTFQEEIFQVPNTGNLYLFEFQYEGFPFIPL